ncbi:MAG TPA: hypothetical protein VM509_04705, partial [Planctomycetota bacterium]|nr:hypothetical protein [Planctomycetota bacterium]
WMEDLLAARERMEDSPALARTLLELALLELCRDEKTVPISVLVQRLTALEQRLGAAPSASPISSGSSASSASSAPAAPRASAASHPTTASEAASAREPRPQVLRPMPPPAPYSTPAPQAPPAMRGAIGHKPAWDQFLSRLNAEDAALGALLARRGQLANLAADRVHIQLKDLRPDERTALAAADVAPRCARLFEAVLGTRVQVVFEDTAGRQAGEKDAFTRSVAELFGGKIEDKS